MDSVEKYTKLMPYIEPLVRGLNSGESGQLGGLLAPLLSQNNPAAAIRDLIKVPSGQEGQASFGNAFVNLFPAVQPLVKEGIPAKQVFTAQILQGLINQEYRSLQVVKDLKGAPAVIISGRARDIFKIAQLPNVDKLLLASSP